MSQELSVMPFQCEPISGLLVYPIVSLLNFVKSGWEVKVFSCSRRRQPPNTSLTRILVFDVADPSGANDPNDLFETLVAQR